MRWPGRKNGMCRPGPDVLVRDGGPGVGLSGHLLLPHEPIHIFNLPDLLFYILNTYVPKICILTSAPQVTSKRTKLFLRFGAKIPRTTSTALWYTQLLSNTVQNQRGRSDFYFREPRPPLVTNVGLVAFGTDRYHILQRVGGHWPHMIQIATDVGSRWEKSEFQLLSFFWIFKILVPNFGPGFFCLVTANANTLIQRHIKQAQPPAVETRTYPEVREERYVFKLIDVLYFEDKFLINQQVIFKLMR